MRAASTSPQRTRSSMLNFRVSLTSDVSFTKADRETFKSGHAENQCRPFRKSTSARLNSSVRSTFETCPASSIFNVNHLDSAHARDLAHQLTRAEYRSESPAVAGGL